jgi:hypothetical protein
MKPRLITAAILGLACVSEGIAKAGAIYNNLSPAGPGGSSPFFGPLADSFSTGDSTSNLTDVKVELFRVNAGTGSTTVSLVSDANTSPGTVLATLGSVSDSSAPNNSTVYDFSLVSPFGLAANTRYWIELTPTPSTQLIWDELSGTSGIGVAGEYSFFNSYGTVPNSAPYGPFQMEVITSTTVPEPSSLALFFVACLAGLPYHIRTRGRLLPEDRLAGDSGSMFPEIGKSRRRIMFASGENPGR